MEAFKLKDIKTIVNAYNNKKNQGFNSTEDIMGAIVRNAMGGFTNVQFSRNNRLSQEIVDELGAFGYKIEIYNAQLHLCHLCEGTPDMRRECSRYHLFPDYFTYTINWQ